MRKWICLSLVFLLLLGTLTGCNFTRNISGVVGNEAEATSKVMEMMKILAEGKLDAAKALLHPQAVENSDPSLAQMSDYLEGRDAREVEVVNISINTSAGTSGKIRQEKVAYRVTLSDESVVYLNVVHLSDPKGSGFSSFQLVLGIVP